MLDHLLYLKHAIPIARPRTVECPWPSLPNRRGVCVEPPPPCRPGEVLKNGRCEPAPCPEGTVRDGEDCIPSPPPPVPCGAGTHQEGGKCVADDVPGPAGWGVWFDSAELHMGSHHGWTWVVGWRVPWPFGDGKYHFQDFTQWIDPSGFVRTTKGLVLPGARVVLYRADAAPGPFARVPTAAP